MEINIIENLNQLNLIDDLIDEKKEEIEALKEEKYQLKSIEIKDKIQNSKITGIETIIITIDERIESISKQLEELLKNKFFWNSVIDNLDNTEKKIIKLKYFQSCSMEYIARELKYSAPHIYRIHDKAIKKIYKMIENNQKMKIS